MKKLKERLKCRNYGCGTKMVLQQTCLEEETYLQMAATVFLSIRIERRSPSFDLLICEGGNFKG